MSTTTGQDTSSENAETTAAWDGPLFDRFVQFREIMTTGLGAFGTMALELAPPRARCPRARRRVRVRRRHAGDRRTRRPVGIRGRRRHRATLRRGERRGCGASRCHERALRGRRRPDLRPRRTLRPGLLALRHDVLREPGGGPAQRPPLARARWNARDGRLAREGRERLDVPRAADRRALRDEARRVRRADVRPRAVLDGGRRYDVRASSWPPGTPTSRCIGATVPS